ncbi:MAG: DNA polymerase, partial [Dehalococcoidia bacterium]
MLSSIAHKVPGTGPLTAKIVMVGEAPGATEVRTGEPFTGSSGELLMRLMQNSGLLRGDVYITNVIKEQPPSNNIDHFIKFATGGKVTMTPAYQAYEQQLYTELAQTNANVYVAIGNVALFALTRLVAVTKRRGSILTGTQIGGKKVIPIIHPASALRQYIFTHFIAHDLARIVEESAFPEVRLPARTYHLKPGFLDSMQYLERCSQAEIIAFDIEVVNEEVSCISFALSPGEVMSIPFTIQGHDYFTVDQEAEIWLKIASILQNPAIKKVGQNIVFDFTFLYRKYGIRVYNLEDTMIAQAICYPDFPKGLDFITSIYTKEPYYKDEGKKWFKFGGSDMDFWLYNAKDSAVCLEAFFALQIELRRMGNDDAYRNQCDLIEPLVYMQEKGILADVKAMQLASMSASDELEKLQEKLNAIAGKELNSASSQQLQDYFYGVKKIKPYVSRATGAISVDALALKRIARKGFPEATLILEMRRLAKLQSTYFDMKIDPDSRIRCSFNPVGTTTGRLSSSKTIFDTGGNMQNLPPVMLSYLSADPEYYLYNIDLAQAENRFVAYIAPEPNMINAFEDHIDLHKQTASLIFSKPVSEVSDEPGSSSIGGGLY